MDHVFAVSQAVCGAALAACWPWERGQRRGETRGSVVPTGRALDHEIKVFPFVLRRVKALEVLGSIDLLQHHVVYVGKSSAFGIVCRAFYVFWYAFA